MTAWVKQSHTHIYSQRWNPYSEQGHPQSHRMLKALGWSYCKYSQEWRLYSFSGPCPSIWSPFSISLEFPLLQVADQLRPLHKSPDASGLPLLQCSCSKHRLKTQARFWNYIIQEHRRGPAVQSATVQRAVRKEWSSFKQLRLQQQQYGGF